jgi:hypothetical protein
MATAAAALVTSSTARVEELLVAVVGDAVTALVLYPWRNT